MARTETKRVKLETVLMRGLRESNADGTIVDDGEDEPFVVRIIRRTEVEVRDGRGKRREVNRDEDEILAEVPLAQAVGLAKSILGDLEYAYEVAERRVLVPEASA